MLGHEGRPAIIPLHQLLMCPAMKKMAASNVLIVGMKGLGVEIGTPALTTPRPAASLTPVSQERRSRRCEECHDI